VSAGLGNEEDMSGDSEGCIWAQQGPRKEEEMLARAREGGEGLGEG